MPTAEAVPQDLAVPTASGWLRTLRGVLFQPRATFASVQPGPVAPAAKLTALSLVPPALAAMLTDDDLWAGHVPRVLARGALMWIFGTAWLLGPQAVLFRLTTRVFGAARPLSLAQRGMAAFSVLLAVFGVALSVAGLSPESAPFVISWYLSLAAVIALGTYALFRFAEGAYDLSPGKAVGALLVFQLVHALALLVALGALFTVVSP